MTEQTTVEVENASLPSETANVSQAPTIDAQEKHVAQSEVNRIVSSEKKGAYEKGLSEGLKQQGQAQPTGQYTAPPTMGQPAYQPNASPEQAYTNPSDLQAMVKDQVSTAVQDFKQEREQADLQAQEKAYVDNLTATFGPKIEAAIAKHPDFEEQMKPFTEQPDIRLIELANGVDNGAEVLLDMVKNPTKISHIQMLLANNQTGLAQRAIQQASESIKTNDLAKNSRTPNEPLGQISPSNIGGDSGKDTLADMKRKYRA